MEGTYEPHRVRCTPHPMWCRGTILSNVLLRESCGDAPLSGVNASIAAELFKQNRGFCAPWWKGVQKTLLHIRSFAPRTLRGSGCPASNVVRGTSSSPQSIDIWL